MRCAGEAGGSGRGGAARTDPGKVQAGSPLADGGGVTGAGPPPGARPRAGPGRTSDRGEGGRRCLLLLTSCRPRAATPALKPRGSPAPHDGAQARAGWGGSFPALRCVFSSLRASWPVTIVHAAFLLGKPSHLPAETEPKSGVKAAVSGSFPAAGIRLPALFSGLPAAGSPYSPPAFCHVAFPPGSLAGWGRCLTGDGTRPEAMV